MGLLSSNVNRSQFEGPLSLTAVQQTIIMQAMGFTVGTFQISGTFVGTFVLEGSNDGTNWISKVFIPANGNAETVSGTSPNLYYFAASERYIRVRCSAFTSGQIDVSYTLEQGAPSRSPSAVIIGTGLPAGTNTIGNVVPMASSIAGGTTNATVYSAASTNLTSVKASIARLYGFQFKNTTAAVLYVKFYNKASAPVPASDTPLFIVPLNANEVLNYSNPLGKSFPLGLAYSIVTGIANTDATAVTANAVIGHLDYA